MLHQRLGIVRQAAGTRQRGEELRIGDDQRHQIRPPVAEDDGLGDLGFEAEDALHLLGRDVVAAGIDDDVLLAVGDAQISVRIQHAHITRVQPAALQRLGGGDRIPEIALHDVGAAHEDLAVPGDPHLHPLERRPHRLDAAGTGRIAGDHRRGLGHAVALQHRQAQGHEEHAHLVGERCAARDHGLEPPAEALGHPAAHQPVEQPVLDALDRRERPLLVASAAQLHRPEEQPCPQAAAAFHLAPDALVQEFEQARHAGDDGGPRLDEVARELLHALGVVDARADGDGEVQPRGVLVGVGERQEGEEDLVAEPGPLQQADGTADVGEDVAVAEHHSLGPAAGARGVDEAGEIVRPGPLREVHLRRRLPLGQRLLPAHLAHVARRLVVAAVHAHHHAHPAHLLEGRVQAGEELGRGHDRRLRLAVLQQIGEIGRPVGGVGGHRHGPGAHDGEIGDAPLGAVLREQQHPLSGRDPRRGEKARKERRLAVHLRIGPGAPRVFALRQEQRGVAAPLTRACEGLQQVGSEVGKPHHPLADRCGRVRAAAA
ncbi:hypothetical protein HRbin39_01929 [bacterium HR39]|nr:hypothetical protein HRbin39_01929 [bacterium HR39]